MIISDNLNSAIIRRKSFWCMSIWLSSALVISSAVNAAETPKPFPTDSRLGELNYDRNQVFQIRVAKGIATHIILGPDEKIVRSAPGMPADCRQESSDWCIVANTGANEIFVQPRTASATTNNLELTTDLRRYSFDFVQATQRAGDAWYRVTFRYEGISDGDAGRVAKGAFGGKACNWNYSMSRGHGTAGFAPLAVFDDGNETFLLMPPDRPIPKLRDGADGAGLRRLPGMTDDRLLVLAGIHDKFLIESGASSFTIWNEGSTTHAPRVACPGW